MTKEEIEKELENLKKFADVIVEYSGSRFDRTLETAINCMQIALGMNDEVE